MSTKKFLWGLLALGCYVNPDSSSVMAESSPSPSVRGSRALQAAIMIDGKSTDWTSADFLANMYEAGDPTKSLAAKAY